MSSEFDSSPRAPKRRKTTRYGTERTILSDDASQDLENGTDIAFTGQADSVTPKSRATRKPNRRNVSKQSPVQADAGAEDNGITDDAQVENVTPSKNSREHSRSKGQTGGNDIEAASTSVNGQQNGADEETGEQDDVPRPNETTEVDDTPKVRSSGRQRKQTTRYTSAAKEVLASKPARKVAPEKATPSKPTASPIKGILTPSRKQKTPGPRKSVMFDQDDAAIGEQLGFKDIGTPINKAAGDTPARRTPRKSALLAREVLADDLEVEDEQQKEVAGVEDLILEIPEEDVIVPELTLDKHVPAAPCVEDNVYVQNIKASILSRLTSASLPNGPPSHLESQYNQIHGLLRSTIVSSESNSLLLLGPRGAGKSMLLSLALSALTNEHSSEFHTVRLNGFLQTDDRLALREIWRQLGREMQVDEMETEDVAASYADTMASLLSLLSHPDEMAVDEPNGTDNIEDLASNALQIAGGGQRTSKSIVFILDEFDLFTNHPRQTLLYNLFDIAQSRKAPIVVIGCSTRMDVIECLEKRVKSRFSHRWSLISNCRTYLEWEALVKDALLVNDQHDLFSTNREQSTWTSEWNKHIETNFLPSKPVQTILKSHFYTTKSVSDLFTALYPLIATLQLNPPSLSPPPTPTVQPSITTTLTPPTLLSLLPTLPTLHLTLLISLTRLSTIHHLPTQNFNLVYTHYTELIAQSRLRQSASGSLASSGSLRAWSRETCRGAWEELGRAGVIVAVVGGRESGVDGDTDVGEWETRMWRGEVTLEEVAWGIRVKFGGGSGGGATGGSEAGVLERWCREI